jgi:hypothetical protein
VDLPSIITSPILNCKERKQRRWKEGEDDLPEEKRTRI